MGDGMTVQNNKYYVGSHVGFSNGNFGAGIDAGAKIKKFDIDFCGTTTDGFSKVALGANYGRNNDEGKYKPIIFRPGLEFCYYNPKEKINLTQNVDGAEYGIKNATLNPRVIQTNVSFGMRYATKNDRFYSEAGVKIGSNIAAGGKREIEKTEKITNGEVHTKAKINNTGINIGPYVRAGYNIKDCTITADYNLNPIENNISVGLRYTF